MASTRQSWPTWRVRPSYLDWEQSWSEPGDLSRLASRRSSPSTALRLPETGPVARLLISVRSADEARTALAGGASIIDVKEPDHGSLGQAPWSVWRDVHTVASTARRSARPSESPRTG